MLKICTKGEISSINHLPKEVVSVVLEMLTILDENYGEERHIDKDLGGYILVVDDENDIGLVNREICMDITKSIPEYVDVIGCSDGEIYTNSLILCGDDFRVSSVMLSRRW